MYKQQIDTSTINHTYKQMAPDRGSRHNPMKKAITCQDSAGALSYKHLSKSYTSIQSFDRPY